MDKDTDIKYCPCCKKKLSTIKFYNSRDILSPDGLSSVCKDCIKKQININDLQSVYNVLKSLNSPFINQYWEKAIEGKGDTFGNYMRMANSLNQLRNKTWEDSVFEEEKANSNRNDINKNIEDKLADFDITEDMIVRWGSKHDKEDYIKLEKFYHGMKDMNRIETPQDIDYLKKLSVISLKMDKELEEGHYDEVKKLGDLYSKYMADSKFRAMDKTDADKTGGIRNFSTIYAEVEKDDFIPPWEHYRKIKGLTQDIIDKTIMHIENFTLRLNKVNIMTEPPRDTPKLDENEIYTLNEGDIDG